MEIPNPHEPSQPNCSVLPPIPTFPPTFSIHVQSLADTETKAAKSQKARIALPSTQDFAMRLYISGASIIRKGLWGDIILYL